MGEAAVWFRAHSVSDRDAGESCTFFQTTIEFLPTLERQRDDACWGSTS